MTLEYFSGDDVNRRHWKLKFPNSEKWANPLMVRCCVCVYFSFQLFFFFFFVFVFKKKNRVGQVVPIHFSNSI
jgi:hypothetical protein